MNITPQQISNLKPNEIFVFGSNLQGNHAGGAARFAVLKFGAEMGNPIGLQGQSYAIPTLSQAAIGIPLDKLKLPISEIGKYVNEFIGFASQHPDMFFYVTPIGCGIAGFTEEEIAPLFSECVNMENVALPETFFSVLGVQDEIDNETLNDNVMENKKVIKLSEAQLHRIIKESVGQTLSDIKAERQHRDNILKTIQKIDSITHELYNLVFDDEFLTQEERDNIQNAIYILDSITKGRFSDTYPIPNGKLSKVYDPKIEAHSWD